MSPINVSLTLSKLSMIPKYKIPEKILCSHPNPAPK